MNTLAAGEEAARLAAEPLSRQIEPWSAGPTLMAPGSPRPRDRPRSVAAAADGLLTATT